MAKSCLHLSHWLATTKPVTGPPPDSHDAKSSPLLHSVFTVLPKWYPPQAPRHHHISQILQRIHKNPTTLCKTTPDTGRNRHFCRSNLNKRLRSWPSVRRRWLRRVRTAQANMIKHWQLQATIHTLKKTKRQDSELHPGPTPEGAFC
jgi:hypothetical protein